MDDFTMHFPSGDEEIEDLADEALTGDQLIEIVQSWGIDANSPMARGIVDQLIDSLVVTGMPDLDDLPLFIVPKLVSAVASLEARVIAIESA